LTQSEFNLLAEIVFDKEATPVETELFELAVERNPDWMDAFLDNRSILDEAFTEVPTTPTNFNQQLLARWQADQIRTSFQYWAPSIVAAVAAGVGLLAILTTLGQPVLNHSQLNAPAEAKLETASSVDFPSLQEPLDR
jgi:hypothetical protein